MQRALLLTLFLVPHLAAAQPSSVVESELLLRDFVHHVSPLAETPDLTVLTTEPVARTESSGYGWREDPINKHQKFHHGTDYRGQRGTPILAAGNGVVVVARRYYGYGKCVIIDHGGGVITRYGHMSKLDVHEGALVSAGDRIGRMGSTGRATGTHLHFEVRLDGRTVDPNTALAVAAVMRDNPAAGQLAAFALAPEIQSKLRDGESPRHRSRPERKGAPQRERALW